MSFPEHLHAALGQLEDHLLQSWELSLHDLHEQNESLRREIAQQYEEILQLREGPRPGEGEAPTPRARGLEKEVEELRALNLELQDRQKKLHGELTQLRAPQANPRAEELEQELQGLQALYQDSQDKRSEMSEQLQQLRQQLAQEAEQNARLTLEMVDLKVEQEKERLRLRGLPEPNFNLPELVAEEKLPDQNEYLQRMAYQDALTGLPNLNLARRYLQIELTKKEKTTVALAILHLEHWNELEAVLNEDQDRQQLAAQFAERARACLRAEDVLARGQGGEFWMIFPLSSGGPLGVKTATELAQRSLARLLENLKNPLVVEDHRFVLNLWAGLSVTQGEEDLASLVRHAQLAKDHAQAKGTHRFSLFLREMEKPAKRRQELVPLLRQALVREQFSLRFQPIVELKTGVIKGVEALVRWEHPVDGVLEPADFLEAACHSGVVVGLGEWVMSCVCELSRDYRSLYWFINLSRPELMQADLPRRLTKAMEAAHLNRPDFIVVECQESDLARRDPRILANLRELQGWKVGISADDFNFSELPLRSLEKRGIRFLKVSPQITQDLDQAPVRQLLKGGLLAAEAAGARVILKGLENQGLLTLALETGCPWGQGHRLCPPLTWPELEAKLAGRQALS